MASTMFALALSPGSNNPFPSFEMLREGGLVSVLRPELIAVGVQWNEVEGGGCRAWFSKAKDWSQFFFTLVKRG